MRAALAAAWRWFCREYVPVRLAVIYAALLAVIFFLLGGLHPEGDVRRLRQNLAEARGDVRDFSNEMTRRNDELNGFRAAGNLNEKTIALLNGRIDELLRDNIKIREELAFYRQILADQTAAAADGIVVRAFSAAPGFAPRQWRLSAVLVRLGRHKPYKGAYYFEILQNGGGGADGEAGGDGGREIVRYPPQPLPLEMAFYYEIGEQFTLPAGREIENIRLVVTDAGGQTVAAEDWIKRDEAQADGGG